MKALDTRFDSAHTVWLAPTELDGKVDHLHLRVGLRSRAWRPPTDVYELEDVVIVRIEVAGMQDAEFSISLENRLLTIQGTRADTAERRAYHQMEINFGEFRTQVELHWAVERERIEAAYDNGFLRLRLPKARPHQIEIGE